MLYLMKQRLLQNLATSTTTDIVDTQDNIVSSDLLGSSSALSSSIRSINVLSGDTLKLTTAQFKRLKAAENSPGELFAERLN